MPSFGGVIFVLLEGKTVVITVIFTTSFQEFFFFLTALWFSWTEVFVILNYQMVPLKKIELRCLEDVLFSVMSMGKVSYKIQPQIWGLLACGEHFFSLSTAMRKKIHVTPLFIPQPRPKLSSFLFYLLK